MLNLKANKIYNAYLIETKNYDDIKNTIKNFAIDIGFDKNLIDKGNHPDFKIITSEENKYSVKFIRDCIIDDVYISPYISNYKMYIIFDADTLENKSQNALLKTLEEPPEYVIFFLIVKNKNLILDTVKSRCIKLYDIEKNDNIDYEKYKDAIVFLSNYQYNTYYKISSFFENLDKNEILNILNVYTIFLKDVLIYKNTIDVSCIENVMLKSEIVNFSTSNSFIIINYFIDEIYNIINNSIYNIDIKQYIINAIFKAKNVGVKKNIYEH